jgi:hypothetical protein
MQSHPARLSRPTSASDSKSVPAATRLGLWCCRRRASARRGGNAAIARIASMRSRAAHGSRRIWTRRASAGVCEGVRQQRGAVAARKSHVRIRAGGGVERVPWPEPYGRGIYRGGDVCESIWDELKGESCRLHRSRQPAWSSPGKGQASWVTAHRWLPGPDGRQMLLDVPLPCGLDAERMETRRHRPGSWSMRLRLTPVGPASHLRESSLGWHLMRSLYTIPDG